MNSKQSFLAALLLTAALNFPVAAARFDAPPLAADSPSSCSELSLRVAIAKTQSEMRQLLPGSNDDPASFGRAMRSDPRFNEKVKAVFGGSDIIKSEFSRKEGCVVTVRLSLDRLQALTLQKVVN